MANFNSYIMLYLKFPEGNHEVSPIISQLAARSSPWASRGLGLPESFAEFLREVQDFFAEALAHLERMGDGHLMQRKFGKRWKETGNLQISGQKQLPKFPNVDWEVIGNISL